MEKNNKIKSIEDLKAWQKAMELCYFVYPITRNKSFESDFDLRRQIRKSCVSPASNIAEGFGRRGNREFVNFLSIALGSLSELDTQLRIAMRFNYISDNDLIQSQKILQDCSNLCSGLISYLNNTEFTGTKYKSNTVKENETNYGFDVNTLINND